MKDDRGNCRCGKGMTRRGFLKTVGAGTVAVAASRQLVAPPATAEEVLTAQDMAKISLTVGPFYAAVRQAAIVTSEERRGVDFTFGEGTLVMAGHGGELGESRVELPIAYSGPDIAIRLDPRFISDFLKVLEPDQNVVVELKDGETAAVCRSDDGYAYVIMPLSQGQ